MVDFSKHSGKKFEPPQPQPLPPLEEGYTRIRLIEIKHSTDKAWLMQTEDGKAWIPKSCCKIYDGHKVIDILNTFYDKNF